MNKTSQVKLKKPELLVPSGDMASLYQAIHNNADAIYVGLKEFGARHFAKNFTKEEMCEAIKVCHLYGVKLYATMNTLIKDNEVDEFIKQIEFLHKNGIDAVIMQDFGMICLVRQMFPNLEIHASTQANNSSIETIKLFHKLGVKRVVLSREMSIEEINSIDVDIEKEVFIHGALCVSYSGNCLMSSMLGSRSGNRGECVGNCRLKYDLEQDGDIVLKDKYLLSTKELNSSLNFSKLLNSNIDSLKIEGRMKSPEYVGFITNFYRKLIDGNKFNLDEELDKLKVLFNRKFTSGHLFHDSKIINYNSPNHIGIKIGKVVKVTNKFITIKLTRRLNQEDGIRFQESNKGLIVNYLYDQNKKLKNYADNIVIIDNKIGLTTKDTVFKTIDKQLIMQLKNIIPKKINIKISLVAEVNKALTLTITDFKNTIVDKGVIVEKAKTSSLSKERIKQQLLKLGNTPFNCTEIECIVDDNVFISIKELNDLRRKAIEKLIKIRETSKTNYIKKEVVFEKLNTQIKQYLTADVSNEEQLKTCLKLGFTRIYLNDINLYNKYQDNEKVYYHLDRNLLCIKDHLKTKNLIGENILFNKYRNIYGDYFLNITNIYSAYYLIKNGLSLIPVSVELDEVDIKLMNDKFKEKFKFDLPLEILVYGRVCNMTIKCNILNLNTNSKYNIIDYKKRIFPVFYKNDRTYILNYTNFFNNYKFNFSYIKRFSFYDETKEQIIEIVNKLK